MHGKSTIKCLYMHDKSTINVDTLVILYMRDDTAGVFLNKNIFMI